MVVALLAYGLIMLFSASFYEGYSHPDYGDGAHFFIRQSVFAAIGLGLMAIAAVIPYKLDKLPWRVWILVGVLWLAAVFALALTLASGESVNGGSRWLEIGNTTIQPSEFAKVVVVLCSAMLAVRLRNKWSPTTVLAALVAVGLPVVLVYLQNDLGTAVIILFGVLVVAGLADYPLKYLAIGALVILIMAAFFTILGSFREGRIDIYFNPWDDTLGKGDQITSAAKAFGAGGIFSFNLGGSHQKYGYISQVQDDMVFPIVGEELGLVGTVVLTLLFLFFVLAALMVAANAHDRLGRAIAGGAGAIVGFQAFLNMLCMTGALPMTGKTLPFFSAGGSSIIVTLIMVGLVLNVSLRSNVSDLASRRRDRLEILDGGGGGYSPGSGGGSSPGSGSRWGFDGVGPWSRQPQPQSKWVKPRTAAPPSASAAQRPAMAGMAGRRTAPPQSRSPLQPQAGRTGRSGQAGRAGQQPRQGGGPMLQPQAARPAQRPQQRNPVGQRPPQAAWPGQKQTQAARPEQRPLQDSAAGQRRPPLRPAKAAAASKTAAQSPVFNPVRSGRPKPAASYSGKGRQ
jgi:cell division protein FtsW